MIIFLMALLVYFLVGILFGLEFMRELIALEKRMTKPASKLLTWVCVIATIICWPYVVINILFKEGMTTENLIKEIEDADRLIGGDS